MQWVQGPSQSNGDNLNNVRCETSRHFRNKKKAYLKAKFEELEINSKIKYVGDLYRDINEFNLLNAKFNPICHFLELLGAHHIFHISGVSVKRGYQPRNNKG